MVSEVTSAIRPMSSLIHSAMSAAGVYATTITSSGPSASSARQHRSVRHHFHFIGALHIICTTTQQCTPPPSLHRGPPHHLHDNNLSVYLSCVCDRPYFISSICTVIYYNILHTSVKMSLLYLFYYVSWLVGFV